MTLAQLRDECKKQELAADGNKKDLLARLDAPNINNVEVEESADEVSATLSLTVVYIFLNSNY